MRGPMLEANYVSKTFGLDGALAARVQALSEVSLTVAQGEFVSLIGPSGCGKSTLLKIFGGLTPAEQGEVYVRGDRVTGPHPHIGMVFQEDSTFPWRTTLGNVEFGLEMRGMARRERRDRSKATIDLVGLTGFEHRYPAELSGGMRQRVAIARALILEPQALLMDEPFGALDEQTRIILGEQLLRIQGKLGQTILFVTHNINEAVQLSDRVVVMTARPGQIKATFNITLPKPRDSRIIASEAFGRLVAQIWTALREESLKGFVQATGAQVE
ncbi:MAG: ABC transporter ATP-binding protein [Deltaproteobacteria bacterium]|nr:ABC transporter ATP-binding protein [Deltaproteobacteria bacterium]MBI3077813.1 ABC transporter ATP-binding protein [Deltaproteobacteria bacterium]